MASRRAWRSSPENGVSSQSRIISRAAAQGDPSLVTPGDVVFWPDHIGIVIDVYPDGVFQVVDGNYSSRLMNRRIKANPKAKAKGHGWGRISGFGVIEKVDERPGVDTLEA